jgi:hypothetical protein
MAYRRGFKAEAERTALTVREELGIGAYERLDPLVLAEHLAIPVTSMTALAKTRDDPDLTNAVTIMQGPELEAVSALTVVLGIKRQVIYNDAHDTGRVANSVTHELSHGLLLHEAAPALDNRGCRIWNADYEDEATYQAGALLIPSKLAWTIAKKRMLLADAATRYGCSEDVIRMRINLSGAGKVLSR